MARSLLDLAGLVLCLGAVTGGLFRAANGECGCPWACEHNNDGTCITPSPCPSDECMNAHGIPSIPCSEDSAGLNCYCVAGSTYCEAAGPEDQPAACNVDVWQCPDGSVLSRDPDNDCEFPECPSTEPEECAQTCPGQCTHDNTGDSTCVGLQECEVDFLGENGQCGDVYHAIAQENKNIPCELESGLCFCPAGSSWCGDQEPVVLPEEGCEEGDSCEDAEPEVLPEDGCNEGCTGQCTHNNSGDWSCVALQECEVEFLDESGQCGDVYHAIEEGNKNIPCGLESGLCFCPAGSSWCEALEPVVLPEEVSASSLSTEDTSAAVFRNNIMVSIAVGAVLLLGVLDVMR